MGRETRGLAPPRTPLRARTPHADTGRMRLLPPSLAAVGASLPDLILGAVFLIAWVAPQSFDSPVIPALMLTMLLEFIIVHSSGFLGTTALAAGSWRRAIRLLVVLVGFYSLFVLGFALAFKTWWPLVSFWGLTVNRLLGLMMGQAPTGEARLFLQRSWAVTAIFYLVFAGLTVMLPIPALGVTGAFREGIPGSGLWVSEPHRVLAFGFLYFTAVGISELFSHRWLPASGLPKVEQRAA